MTSYENLGRVAGESDCQVTIHQTEELFKSNFAILSRGRSRRNFLIITFLQSSYSATVKTQDLSNILQYIVSLASKEDAKQGFVLIFDRRNDYWSTVCSNLTATLENFPANIQKIYVLQPSSFIQRNLIDPSLKFLKDDQKYKVLLLSSVEELHHHVDADQLTTQLNGSLPYNHLDWMQKQMVFENLAFNIFALTQKLKKICRTLQEDDFPNSSNETEQLLIDHELMRADAEDQFDSLNNKVAAILEDQDSNSPKYLQELSTISQRLSNIISDAKKSFKNFCSKHRTKLEHCLQLRKFEEEFKQVQSSVSKYNNFLRSVKVDSDLAKSKNGLKQLLTFQNTSKAEVEEAKELLKCGLEFIDGKLYAVDCIKPKCVELQDMINNFDELLSFKTNLLRSSVHFLTTLDKVNQLCVEGVDLLARQSVEDYKSQTSTNLSISTIDQFLASAEAVDVSVITKSLESYTDEEHLEFKKSSESLISKFFDVKSMCLKRRDSLLSSISKKVRPIQLVIPEVSTSNNLTEDLAPKSAIIIDQSPSKPMAKPDFFPVKKKEKSTDCDSALTPLLCVHG